MQQSVSYQIKNERDSNSAGNFTQKTVFKTSGVVELKRVCRIWAVFPDSTDVCIQLTSCDLVEFLRLDSVFKKKTY